ncbi:hypothetical protein P2S23_19520, partial [Escherichia coli]
MIDPVLEYRLSQIQSRINEDRFLKNNGSGNEIGFWIFDYPAQCELQVREHLGNDSNLLIVFYVQIMPDDFVMQLH